MAYIDYSDYCEDYDNRYSSEMSAKEDYAVIKLLSRYITPTSSVLDVGSGTGYLLDILDHTILSYERYLGIDANARMINKAKSKYPLAKFMFEYASGAILPKAHYDVSVSLFSIPYIGCGSIDTISEAMKEDGYFIAVYYNKPYLNKDSVYYGKKLKYLLTVKPYVKRVLRYANTKMICVDEGDLTGDKTYKYAVFIKGE